MVNGGISVDFDMIVNNDLVQLWDFYLVVMIVSVVKIVCVDYCIGLDQVIFIDLNVVVNCYVCL